MKINECNYYLLRYSNNTSAGTKLQLYIKEYAASLNNTLFTEGNEDVILEDLSRKVDEAIAKNPRWRMEEVKISRSRPFVSSSGLVAWIYIGDQQLFTVHKIAGFITHEDL